MLYLKVFLYEVDAIANLSNKVSPKYLLLNL